MGKGKIVSGGLDGKYNVAIKRKRTRILFEISMLKTQQEQIIKKLFGMEDGPRYDALQLQLTAVKKRIAFLDKSIIYGEDEVKEAWCADLTENLSGDVGTMEVPGELGKLMIRPGYNSQAVYDADRDGQLGNAWEVGAAATFVNLALLPGWQKWMPTCRFARITAIDYALNVCDVEFEPAVSSAQHLDINSAVGLGVIPIVYMECNSGAFKVGDRVVVEYENQNTSSPRVIGFADNPKLCGFKIRLQRDDGVLIDNSYDVSFVICRLDGSAVPTAYIYDTARSYWRVFITDGAKAHDGVGYWVDCLCPDSVRTQYPYRYKLSAMRKATDLIKYGPLYDFRIPYLKIIASSGAWPSGVGNPDAWPTDPGYITVDGLQGIRPGHSIERTITVKSSVPYQVKYYGAGAQSYCNWFGPYYDDLPIGWTFRSQAVQYYAMTGYYRILPSYDIKADDGVVFTNGGQSFIPPVGNYVGAGGSYGERIIDYTANMGAGNIHRITIDPTMSAGITYPVYGVPPTPLVPVFVDGNTKWVRIASSGEGLGDFSVSVEF